MIKKLLITVSACLFIIGCAGAPDNFDESLFIGSRITDMKGFSDELAAVRVDDQWGYINEAGRLVVQPQFSEAGDFSEGLAPIRLNARWGLINKKGQYVIIPHYDGAGRVSNNLMPVLVDGKWGYISPPHKAAIPPQFDEAGSFAGGFALVKLGGRWGYIDKSGKIAVNPRFASAGDFADGRAPVSETGVDDSFGYIDDKGAVVIEPVFDAAGVFSQGLAPVLDDGVWGYIDVNGRMVINLQYEEAGLFGDDLAPVKSDGKWGYIDKKGAIVVAHQFSEALSFKNGLALVVDLNGKGYYIDRAGKQVNHIIGAIAPAKLSPPTTREGIIASIPAVAPPTEIQQGRALKEAYREGSEAGFIDIGPVSYSFKEAGKDPLIFTTTLSHIFYSYHPADESTNIPLSQKPVFVMLNGGPGAATATNLLSMNTAPYTLDREHQDKNSRGYSKNPYSWIQAGHLLYIDAPATGFSYLESRSATSTENRRQEFFLKGNFNAFIDASQILRVVLRFLDSHQELQRNPVILVGESYGGTRVSTMMNLVLFNQSYKKHEKIYRDDGLVKEIETHFSNVYPGETPTPKVVARQFGRQILIQPELSGVYQDDISGKMFYQRDGYKDPVMVDLAKEAGFPGQFNSYYPFKCRAMGGRETVSCAIMYWAPHFNRDRYNCSKRNEWSDELEAYSTKRLREVEALSTLLQYDVTKIKKMYAKERWTAFKLIFGINTHQGGYMVDKDQADVKTWYLDPSMEKYLPSNPKSMAKLQAYAESQDYRTKQLGELESGKNHLWDKFGWLYPWDGYMIEMNLAVYLAFTTSLSDENTYYDLNPDASPLYGRMFLENLPLVNTFLTDAAYDLVIYSPAIPEALKRYTDLVENVNYVRGKDMAGGDLGTFVVTYKPGAPGSDRESVQAALYYPYYESSGHSVSSAQPKKLLSDVKAWLRLEKNQ